MKLGLFLNKCYIVLSLLKKEPGYKAFKSQLILCTDGHYGDDVSVEYFLGLSKPET